MATHLEDAADALLSALPPEEREGILLPRSARLRGRGGRHGSVREVALNEMVAALDKPPGAQEIDLLGARRLLETARLSLEERATWILVQVGGFTAVEVAELLERHPETISIHPRIVSERLGHSDVRLTLNTYSHVLPAMDNEAADLMDLTLRETIRPPRRAAAE